MVGEVESHARVVRLAAVELLEDPRKDDGGQVGIEGKALADHLVGVVRRLVEIPAVGVEEHDVGVRMCGADVIEQILIAALDGRLGRSEVVRADIHDHDVG